MAREQQLRHLVMEERQAAEQRDRLLRRELAAQAQRVEAERHREAALQKQLKELGGREKSEVGNMTRRLVSENGRIRQLLKDKSSLVFQLRGGTAQLSHMKTEVGLLRRRVQDGDKAREQAEKTAKLSQDRMADAQAVARQLSGTVPQLLEQAQLAHEARDAEKALRTQTQANAQAELNRLQHQYSSVVQGQLEQLNFELPKLANASAGMMEPSEDLTAAVEQAAAPQAAAAPAPGEDVSAGTEAGVASAQQPPDLSKDSQGLGSLLEEPAA